MKRILIFLLLGPVVGYAIYLLWQLSLGRSIGGVEGVLLGFPFAYIFGVLPTLAIGLGDRILQRKIGLWPRVVAVALIGYCASMAMMTLWTAVPIPLPHLLSFGIVGAAQGAVCSWLSAETPPAGLEQTNRGAA